MEEKVEVLFRYDTTKDFKGTIFAVFPYDIADHDGNVTTYQHIGQHSAGDYNHCLQTSRQATPEEYQDLKKELESIGYELNIIKKRNYDKYLCQFKNLSLI
jgi:hypothetical protein